MPQLRYQWKGRAHDFQDENIVKVVLDVKQYAMYFSRSPIPFHRSESKVSNSIYKHWGIYAYRKHILDRFVSWQQGKLEKIEKLEQLRALENGVRILVSICTGNSVGVDVPADIEKVEAILQSRA